MHVLDGIGKLYIYVYKHVTYTYACIYIFLLPLKGSDLEQNISGAYVQLTQVY